MIELCLPDSLRVHFYAISGKLFSGFFLDTKFMLKRDKSKKLKKINKKKKEKKVMADWAIINNKMQKY